MHRPVRTRLTACLVAAAATTALGVALAPAAQAGEPGPRPAAGSPLLDHLRNSTSSNAPNVMSNVPPFGRKLG